MKYYYIAVAGNIGVGKSTLTRLLSARLSWEPVYESFEANPYLSDFYQDMPRWSFHSQIFFLSRRLQQHHKLLERPGSVIQDRSVYEDAEIFARNLFETGVMSERDWRCYGDLYRAVTDILTPPDLVIYLRASLPVLRSRITQRGRDYEQSIDDAYLSRLSRLYDTWAADFSRSPLLTVDTDNLNPLRYDAHLDQIWSKIEQRLQGKDFLTL